jgi:hypothetical protein
MIDLEIIWRKELENLQELKIRGRLSNHWLKEIFGEKGEISEGRRLEGVRINEGVRIETISRDQDSFITLEGSAGDSGLATLEDVESHQGNGTILYSYVTPPTKEIIPFQRKGTGLGSPHPQCLLQIW